MAANVRNDQLIDSVSLRQSWYSDNFDLRIKQISVIALPIIALAAYCYLTNALPIAFTVALFGIGAIGLIACLALKILQIYLNYVDTHRPVPPTPQRPLLSNNPAIRSIHRSSSEASNAYLGHRSEVSNETQDYEFNANFQKITFAAPGILRITHADTTSLKIEGAPRDMNNIDVHPDGQNLILGLQPNSSLQTTRQVTYNLTSPNLSEIKLTGSGKIVVEGIRGNSFTCSVNGSGELEASGEVTDLNVEIAGGGSAKCQNLSSRNGNVAISGSGSAWVNVVNRLKVSGNGTCHYANNPTIERNRGASIELIRA